MMDLIISMRASTPSIYRVARRLAMQALPLERKRYLYRIGAYAMEVPDGPTGYWTDDDWVRHIDRTGFWYKPDTVAVIEREIVTGKRGE